MARIYVLDGAKVTSLEAFFDLVGQALIPGAAWGHNLDAFNDILRGGFGVPVGGLTLRWVNSETSRAHLGYSETIRQLKKRLERCHPANRDTVRAQLASAEQREGPTVFDWLLEIIRDHGSGGEQADDKVRLVLE